MIGSLRTLLAILALLLVAACQQPTSTGTAKGDDGRSLSETDGELQTGEHLRYFRPEADKVTSELLSALIAACYGQIHETDRFQGCLRERMALAFDDSGLGRTKCDHYTDLDKYADCLILGNMVLQLRKQLSDDTPPEADFWTSKDAMMHAVVKSLAIGALVDCATTGDENAMASCIDQWFARRAELPQEYVDRCQSEPGKEREVCLGQAATLKFMRDHVGRVSGLST